MQNDQPEYLHQYEFSQDDRYNLGALHLLPREHRITIMNKYLGTHGITALLNFFANYVGLTNSLLHNAEEMAIMTCITEGKMNPTSAEKINLPSLLGAFNGMALSSGTDQSKLCGTCAYRHGSIANQCLITVSDAISCQEGRDGHFMCHENLDDKGEPTQACAGYAQKVAAQK